MDKKFKRLSAANTANISLWVFFILFIIIWFAIWVTSDMYYYQGEYYIETGDGVGIVVSFIMMLIVGIACGILNLAIAISVLVYHNDVPVEDKNFLLICGILFFFFSFTINCVVHKRLKKLSKLETYGNMNNQAFIQNEQQFLNNQPMDSGVYSNNQVYNQPQQVIGYPNTNSNPQQLPQAIVTIPTQQSNVQQSQISKKDPVVLAEELEKIFSLKEKGIIDEQEFLKMKKSLIDSNC